MEIKTSQDKLPSSGGNTNNKIAISYINKKEASFLLGKMKFVECTGCPDFYEGCKGNLPQQEIACMPDGQYLQVHTRGTEKHLCGKLRNIINLSAAQEQEIAMQFEKEFNNKVSMLSRKGDKYVLIHDVDEFENLANGVRRQIMREFETRAEAVNKKNHESFEELQQRLDYMESKVVEQEEVIRKLKRNKTKE